jgi:hypothetical protein
MRFATPAAACLLLCSVPVIALPEPLTAQQQETSVLHWWHGAVAVGGISALMLLDRPTQRFAQDNRGTGSNDVAGLVRHFGQPEVYGTITAGLIVAGLVSHQDRIAQTGGRLALALLVAGAAMFAGGAVLLFRITSIRAPGRHPDDAIASTGEYYGYTDPGSQTHVTFENNRGGDYGGSHGGHGGGHDGGVSGATGAGWARA